MRIYRVGGCVRDHILKVQVHDEDFLVTGSTPEEMIEKGFELVGDHFPVFLHPTTRDEYALARTEKKTGTGYQGFDVDFSSEITVEQDLLRRDLSINSMAQEVFDDGSFGDIIDPYGGQRDIELKVLRHVSTSAFVEDPVRILRLARFMARLGPEWSISPDTLVIAKRAIKDGLMKELNSQRVLKEFSRALMEYHPSMFFIALEQMGALEEVFPEVHALTNSIENPKWHPEGTAFAHTMLVLDQAAQGKFVKKDLYSQDDQYRLRLACLTHDFGKGLTPIHMQPKHYGHETSGLAPIASFCDRLHLNHKMKTFLSNVCRYHMNLHKLKELKPRTVVRMIMPFIKHEDLSDLDVFLALGFCDSNGRLFSSNGISEHSDGRDPRLDLVALRSCAEQVAKVRFQDVFGVETPKNANKIQQEMEKARIKVLVNHSSYNVIRKG